MVQSFDPGWLADSMQWAVLVVAVPILIWAANVSMLGLSRHSYVLATNRQIPSWLGKLQNTRSTPYVAIVLAGLLALGLAIPADIKFLAGVYAFGALLAITIAHASVIRLRFTDPDRDRPYRVPLSIGRAADAGGDRGHGQRPGLDRRLRRPRARRCSSAAAGCCSGWSPTSSTAATSRGPL